MLAMGAVRSVAADVGDGTDPPQEMVCGPRSVCMKQQALMALVAAGTLAY